MEISETIRINSPREQVFSALNNVEILKQAIPGCEDIQALSDTEFEATLVSKVGPLKVRFTGTIMLSDIVVPESYTLRGHGRGGPAGHAKITSHIRLVEDGNTTIMSYDVKADIGGKLAQIGGHLVEKTAKKVANEFFQKFEVLIGPAEETEAIALSMSPNKKGTNMWLWGCLGGGAVILIVWLTAYLG